MKYILTILCAALSMSVATFSYAVDQCNTTAQCKQTYGAQATDCLNSASANSICMCGSVACSAPPGGGGGGGSDTLGRFNKVKDLLLCNYDGKPDEDDLHAVAGLATMLSDSRFSGVKAHCTAGAYGTQGGTFLKENRLFNLAFSNRWASAHDNYNNAVNQAFNKARDALNAGGKVWVAEAGQSDFTADVVRRIKATMPSVNTKTRIHVVQHSNWNEDKTTPSDLAYVKNNTAYHKIADGNSSNNATPGLTINNGSQWSRAVNDAQVGNVWQEARAAALRWMGVNWDNEKIKKGGMDFSDTVEVMWIFGFENQNGGVKGFFDAFL
ncbi:hypothetical protein CBF23_010270 [Marinomonas agarivorans]|nr:hypothetical protein CBF23_010270 [Marinomonas agarivorans]